MARVFDEETFNKEIIEGKGTALIDFYADWCGPCKMMAPIIESISEQYADKLIVGKVNIDQYQNLAVNYKVMSIPTLILFVDGNKAETIIGLVDKSEIENMLQKYI